MQISGAWVPSAESVPTSPELWHRRRDGWAAKLNLSRLFAGSPLWRIFPFVLVVCSFLLLPLPFDAVGLILVPLQLFVCCGRFDFLHSKFSYSKDSSCNNYLGAPSSALLRKALNPREQPGRGDGAAWSSCQSQQRETTFAPTNSLWFCAVFSWLGKGGFPTPLGVPCSPWVPLAAAPGAPAALPAPPQGCGMCQKPPACCATCCWADDWNVWRLPAA